jgi:hypothetical protein
MGGGQFSLQRVEGATAEGDREAFAERLFEALEGDL